MDGFGFQLLHARFVNYFTKFMKLSSSLKLLIAAKELKPVTAEANRGISSIKKNYFYS